MVNRFIEHGLSSPTTNWKKFYEKQYLTDLGWNNVFTSRNVEFKKISLEGHSQGIDHCVFYRSQANKREYLISSALSINSHSSDILVWDINFTEDQCIFRKELEFVVHKIYVFGTNDKFLIVSSDFRFFILELFELKFSEIPFINEKSKLIDFLVLPNESIFCIFENNSISIFSMDSKPISFGNTEIKEIEHLQYFKPNNSQLNILVFGKTGENEENEENNKQYSYSLNSIIIYSVNNRNNKLLNTSKYFISYQNNNNNNNNNSEKNKIIKIPFLSQPEYFKLFKTPFHSKKKNNNYFFVLGYGVPIFPFNKFLTFYNLQNSNNNNIKFLQELEITGNYLGVDKGRKIISIEIINYRSNFQLICLEEMKKTNQNLEILRNNQKSIYLINIIFLIKNKNKNKEQQQHEHEFEVILQNQIKISEISLFHNKSIRNHVCVYYPFLVFTQYTRNNLVIFNLEEEKNKNKKNKIRIHESMNPIFDYFLTPITNKLVIPSRDATITIIDFNFNNENKNNEFLELKDEVIQKYSSLEGEEISVWRSLKFINFLKYYPHQKYFLRNLVMQNTLDIFSKNEFYIPSLKKKIKIKNKEEEEEVEEITDGKEEFEFEKVKIDKNILLRSSKDTEFWESPIDLSEFLEHEEKIINENEEEELELELSLPSITSSSLEYKNEFNKILLNFNNNKNKNCKIEILDEDCLNLVNRIMNNNNNNKNKLMLLNCANRNQPNCVSFGYNTLEENIHTRTNLGCSLDDVFHWDRGRKWKYPISLGSLILSKYIFILRNDEKNGYSLIKNNFIDNNNNNNNTFNVVSISAISLPEVYFDEELEEYRLSRKDEIVTDRIIEHLFLFCMKKKIKKMVLTALGCGSFKNPPRHVAEIFLRMCKKYGKFFENIYFAINTKENLQVFRNVFEDVL